MKTTASPILAKLFAILCCAVCTVSLVGCSGDDNSAADSVSSADSFQQEGAGLSENILFSVNHGAAASSGTKTETADAEIIVYADGKMEISMVSLDFESEIVIGTLWFSQEDLNALNTIANPEKLHSLKVNADQTSSADAKYITVYDESDNVLERKGGSQAQGKDFIKTYNSIKKVINKYPVDEMVSNYKLQLEAAENAVAGE